MDTNAPRFSCFHYSPFKEPICMPINLVLRDLDGRLDKYLPQRGTRRRRGAKRKEVACRFASLCRFLIP